MDTSNRLNKVHLILGSARITLSSLRSEERLQLLRQIVHLCKPLLPYMTQLETFERLRGIDGGMRVRHPKFYSGAELEPPLSEETQFFTIAILEKTDVGPSPPALNALRLLLLTREGALVEWEYRYALKDYAFGSTNHEDFIYCGAKVLTEEELLRKINGSVLKQVLADLSRRAQQGVDRKKRHLESMEIFSRIVGGAHDRTTA